MPARWDDAAGDSGLWSGYDAALCKATRSAVWRNPTAMEKALAARGILLSRKAITGIEERGSCQRSTFRIYCDALDRHPSDFDRTTDVRAFEPGLDLGSPDGICFRPIAVPVRGNPRAHEDSAVQAIVGPVRLHNRGTAPLLIEGVEVRLAVSGHALVLGASHWANLSDLRNGPVGGAEDADAAAWAAMDRAPPVVGSTGAAFGPFSLPPHASISHDMLFRPHRSDRIDWRGLLTALDDLSIRHSGLSLRLSVRFSSGGRRCPPAVSSLPIDADCIDRTVTDRMRQRPADPDVDNYVQFRISVPGGTYCGAQGPECFSGLGRCRVAGQ